MRGTKTGALTVSQNSFSGTTALPSDDDIFIEKVIKELLPVIENNLDDTSLSKKKIKKSGFSK
ncbi:hypothetical protein [Klebsiella quasipneumoniae]|uniref:hypothetical protein n=1 Tax=Klebsiella quasipneumoniae TaxID=1463165 RepID=UPI00115D4358|nr:hypothetical protein [Klebsiella quasipneumoniae]